MPISVLHMIDSIKSSAGGTSTAFVEIVESLRTQPDIRVRAVSAQPPPGDEISSAAVSRAQGGWTLGGDKGRLRPGSLTPVAIAALESEPTDIIHFHGIWGADVVALAAHAQSRGTAVIWHPHGMLVRQALAHSRTKKAIFKVVSGMPRVMNRSSALIWTSEGERTGSDLSMFGSASATITQAVIPLPVPIDLSPDQRVAFRAHGRASMGVGPQVPVVVFVGRMHPVKRVDLTIRAFAHARQQSGAKLILVGGGDAEYTAAMQALARELGVFDHITFAGWQSGQTKWTTLCSSDVLMINSEFENFCYALVEGLIAEVPAVMSDNLAMAAQVQAAGAGLSAPGTGAALGDALAKFLAMTPDQRHAMGRTGRDFVQANFGREVIGAKLADVYRRVMAGRSATRAAATASIGR